MTEDLMKLMQQANKFKEDESQTIDGEQNTEPQVGITMMDLIDIEDNSSELDLEVTYNVCTYCGNTGMGVGGETPCPKCGREYVIKTTAVEDYPTYVNVPARYKNNDWDKEKAKNITCLNYVSSAWIKKVPIWLEMLDKLLQRADKNFLFSDSYIISAPEGTAKTIWTFTFIKKLHHNNVKVSPIFILNDLDAQSKNIKMYQVLIVEVTKFNFVSNMDKLDYILHKRKLLDLPTIVISSVPYNLFVSSVDQAQIHFDEAIALS